MKSVNNRCKRIQLIIRKWKKNINSIKNIEPIFTHSSNVTTKRFVVRRKDRFPIQRKSHLDDQYLRSRRSFPSIVQTAYQHDHHTSTRRCQRSSSRIFNKFVGFSFVC